MIVYLISVVILVLSFFMTAFIQAFATQEKDSCSQVATLSELDALKTADSDDSYTQSASCYCDQLSLSERFSGANADHCNQFKSEYIVSAVIGFLAGLTSFFVNWCIRLVQKEISKFSKFYTYIEEYNSLMFKVFLPILFNTCLITPLIYANIYGFKPGVKIRALFNYSHGEEDIYADFSFAWFEKVGAAMTNVMIINCLNPLTGIIQAPLEFCYSKWRARRLKSKRKIVEMLEAPPFSFHFRYAYSMMTVALPLFFEPMLPFAPIFSAITLWVDYFGHKVSLFLGLLGTLEVFLKFLK